MNRYIFILIVLLSSAVKAAPYDRAFITQCLEEQSYTGLLEYTTTVPVAEHDHYILNAAGYAAFQIGLPDKSAYYYTASLDKDSNNIQANLYLGLIKKQQKKTEESLYYFKKLAQIKPGQAKYLKYIAECYSGIKNEDSALDYLKRAYTIAPSDLNIAGSYADLLYSRKMYEQADRVVYSGLMIDSNHVSLLGTGIKSFYQQKKYKSVLPLATRLSGLGLGDIAFTSLMFGVFASLQLKDYAQSLVYSDYLIKDGTGSEQAYYYTAKAYAGLKQYEKSNEFLKKCLELAISDNTESYYLEIAENMERMKYYGKAQKNYDTARFLFGSNMVLYRKALAYDAAEQKDKARKAYMDFLKGAKEEDTAVLNFAKKRIESLSL